MDRQNLYQVALTHVVEGRFERRDKNRIPRLRRMLFTLDVMLLNSYLGKNVLHFRKPTHPPAYDAKSKNLLFVWDIIMQDWRAVPCDAMTIVRVIPTRKPKGIVVEPGKEIVKAQEMFWKYFNTEVLHWDAAKKRSFMDQ